MDLLQYSTRQEDETTLPETVNKNFNIRIIGNKRRNIKRIKDVLSINLILNFVSEFSRYNNNTTSTMTTDQ